MKEEYIKAIMDLLEKTNDMSMIDLVYQLLKKQRQPNKT